MDYDIRSLERYLVNNIWDVVARERYTSYLIKVGRFISISKRIAKHRHQKKNRPNRPPRVINVIRANRFNPGKPHHYTLVVRR